MSQKLIDQINRKYESLGENPETYLSGLLESKPITYWDYISVETLLSLQRPRTAFDDEKIFIMYHQVTELVLNMMIHEIKQLVFAEKVEEDVWISKIGRLNRYTRLLITSFDIMKDGMSYEDYNQFRTALAPASGFQSVQFRFIELYCTRLTNLVHVSDKDKLPIEPTIEDYFQVIYWKNAGLNRQSGKKTITLRLFEEKYLKTLIDLAKLIQGSTLEEKLLSIESPSYKLRDSLKEFDKLYNVDWPTVHLSTAQHYLDRKGKAKQATGSSEWKKYLDPRFQNRVFFPSLLN